MSGLITLGVLGLLLAFGYIARGIDDQIKNDHDTWRNRWH